MKGKISFTLSLLFLGWLTACVHFSVGYKPPVVPVRLVIHDDGSVSLEGSSEWVTPIGTFSLDTEYVLVDSKNALYLVLRNHKQQTDQVFKIRRDKLVMSLEGNAQIQASSNKIIIDVTNANVQEVRFLSDDEKELLSPTDVVINYWAYVGTKNYQLSWPMLSEGFQERNHNGNIKNYIQGYRSLDLCNVEARNVRLRERWETIATVDARVVYYKGAQCKKYTFSFEHELIWEDGQWKIEHVYYK